MTHCFIEPRARKYVKECWFLSFRRNLSNIPSKQLLAAARKAGLNALRKSSQRVVHKAARTTGESVRNKIAEKIVIPKPMSDANSRCFQETVIPSDKRREILNELIEIL